MHYLLHPTYCPDIFSFALISQGKVRWEVEDNYQKQTFRNRCHISTDQGRQLLIIPIVHAGGRAGRQKYREVRTANSAPWQRQHWRSLQTAYRSSPFFEYYEDDLAPLFEKKYSFLLDVNLASTALLCHCLSLPVPSERTTGYEPHPAGVFDARILVNAKQETGIPWRPYPQVFDAKHGFIPGLSVLDLLFNLGPEARQYLADFPIPSRWKPEG